MVRGPWSMLSCRGWNCPPCGTWRSGYQGPWPTGRTKDKEQRTKHARGVDMESALVLVEKRDGPGIERVLRANDEQAVALNQSFQQRRSVSQVIDGCAHVGAHRMTDQRFDVI